VAVWNRRAEEQVPFSALEGLRQVVARALSPGHIVSEQASRTERGAAVVPLAQSSLHYWTLTITFAVSRLQPTSGNEPGT
jgi:hypothetical protein